MTPSKDHSNLPVTKPTDMEICDLPEKEFKIAALNFMSYNKMQKDNSAKSRKQ